MACQTENTILRILGVGFDHFDEEAAKVKIKYNTTLMKNYSGSTGWIEPYGVAEQRSAPDCSPYNDGGCPDNPCYKCNTGPGSEGYDMANLFCWPIDDTFIQPTPAGSGSFNINYYESQVWHNNYSQSNMTSSEPCRLIGFKNVYANRPWFGRWSYTSRMYEKDDSMGWCCSCAGAGDGGFHHFDPTPDQTKYLQIHGESTVVYTADDYDTIIGDEVTCCCSTIEGCCPSCGCGEGDDGCSCTVGNCESHVFTGTHVYTAFGSNTCTVDTLGNMGSACSSGSSGWCNDDDPDIQYSCRAQAAADGFGGIFIAENNYTVLQGIWCSFLGTYSGCEGCGPPDVIEWDDATGTGHVEYHTTIYDRDGCGCITDTRDEILFEMTLTQTSFEAHGYGVQNIVDHCPCDGYSPEWIEISHINWNFSDLAMNYEAYGFNPSWSSAFTGQRNTEGSIGSPFTAAQAYADVVSLLGTWDMGSNKVYPWRLDANKTIGPMVTRDCQANTPSLGFCSSSHTYSGRIIGAPAPEGIDRVWMPWHENMCVCDSLVQPGCFAFFTRDHGQWSNAYGCPPRATQITNFFEANNLLDGAFVGGNFFYTFPSTCHSAGSNKIFDDTIWACKYAEVVFPKQSYNWIRPCESDKWQVSSSGTNCVTSFTESVVTIDLGFFGSTPNLIQPGRVAIMGTGERDGIYLADSVGADTINVTSCVVSASDFPYDPFFNPGTGWIGNVKWDYVPSICGTASINNISISGSEAIVDFGQPMWLINDESIFINGVTGMSGVNGYWTVEMAGDNTLWKLQGSNASGSYRGHGYAYSPFAPDPKWNSTSTKNEVMNKKWSFNYRDVGEYYRLSSSIAFEIDQFQCTTDIIDPVYVPCVPTPLPPNPRTNQCGIDQNVTEMSCTTEKLEVAVCTPNVIYYSPNEGSESFHSGSKNGGWFRPGTDGFYCDSKYGTMWNAIPQQTMDDPLNPYVPCLCSPHTVGEDDPETHLDCHDCSYSQDDGSCEPDVEGDPDLDIECHKFYRHANQYEARCKPPDGAPALPGGESIGCATTPPPNCNQHFICSAPLPYGDFPNEETCAVYRVFIFEDPWVLRLVEEACVCAEGRFAEDYERNGVQCMDDAG